MLKYSIGLRNALLGTSPLVTLLNGSVIHIYSGTPPASPNDAIGSAVLLAEISNAGTPVTFESAITDATLTKSISETWSGTTVAAGTATFYRLVTAGDAGAASTTAYRIQGSVAKAGADMNLTNPVLASGATQTLDSFYLSMPES